MEPAAPGTEDEPICTQEFKSSKDALELSALSKKAVLPNGKYENIYLLEYVGGSQHWFCKVCNRPVLGRIFSHEAGKKHIYRLKLGNNAVVDGEEDDNDKPSLLGSSMVVAPGEPLPPGFEGEIEENRTQIQDCLDKFKVGPLVGLEYLLELLDYDPSKEPSYMCILCHKKGDPRTVLSHLASFNHQVQYLQRHFPTAYRRIAPYMVKVYKRNWQAGLQKVCDAIESTFGRLKPIQVEAGKYDKDSHYYMELVAKGKHFNELSGQNFENVVSVEELTKIHDEPKKIVQQAISNPPKRKSPSPPVVAKPVKRPKPQLENIKKRSLSPVSDVSSSDLEEYDSKPSSKLYKGSERKQQKLSRSPVSKREGHMPWQKSTYRKDRPYPVVEKPRDEKFEKMEEFRRLAKAIDNQMELTLKKHKENPEKHPKYNDEWKKFWNTRYKELQAAGKNAATHDFKPEWIEFWNKRMLELHQEEVLSNKAALRKRLGLEDPAPVSFKIGERRKPQSSSNKPLPTAAQPDNDPEVMVIEDIDEDNVRSDRNRMRSPFKKRDGSPQFRRRLVNSPPPRRERSHSPNLSHRRNESPPSYHRESAPTRRRASPISYRPSPPSLRPVPTRRASPPPIRRTSPPQRRSSPSRRGSPLMRRSSPPLVRPSPPSLRMRGSPKRERALSPLSRRKGSPSFQRAPSPPSRIRGERFSASPIRDTSPRHDKYERLKDMSEERSRSRGKSREISWERERERRREYDEKHWERSYRSREPWDVDPYAPPKVLRDVTRQPIVEPIEEDDDGNVNIVAVLRLLTALEEKLGSLGPKVIDLLAQALAMEKKEANSSEQLLDSEMNCVLFETVKEKLKGQLQAGFVDWIQEKAFKNAIKKTASLIHIASERKRQQEKELPKKPVIVPGIGKVDKGKIARQIANALIAQGKTDVTQNELEELINAVVGIAEAQKNSSETLTTASFLEKLASSQSKETSKIEEKPEPDSALKHEKKEKESSVQKLDEDQVSTSSLDRTTINMEGLSDSDLETLMQNFKDLSSDEQLGLINYLKKLEAKEPERVEKLRKFVNLPENVEEKSDSGRYSPFALKIEESLAKTNEPQSKEDETEKKEEEQEKEDNSGFINIDSDDEYSFDDVAKAVSQKVNASEQQQKRKEDKDLDDAKAFITTLMSSLNKSVSNSPVGTSATPSITTSAANTSTSGKINLISNIPVSSTDITNSLSGITMSVSSLGNILGNIKSMTNDKIAAEKQAELAKSVNPTQPSITPDFKQTGPIGLTPSNPINSEPLRGKPYNDFDISSQRDLNNDYNSPNFMKGRSKPYDEFNIGPISRDAKEDIRMPVPVGNRLPERAPGYPDNRPSSRMPYQQDRLLQMDLKPPYSQMQGGPVGRGSTIQERPPQSFPNQLPQRQGTLPNKPGPFPNRPGNNFESNIGHGDFGPRGAAMPDFRGGVGGNFRGNMTDYRAGPDDFREQDDYRGPNNYRGGPDRGGRDDYRDEPNFRGNDFREMRGPGPQGNNPPPLDDNMRNRGNFGYQRGGQNFKGGNFNNSNRNFSPGPRYPGNNYNAPFNRW